MSQIKDIVWYSLGIASIYVAVVSAIFGISPDSLAGTSTFAVAAAANLFVVVGLVFFIFSEKAPFKIVLIPVVLILGFFLAPVIWIWLQMRKRHN